MTDRMHLVRERGRDLPQIAAVLEKARMAASLAGVPFSPRCCVYRPTMWAQAEDPAAAGHHVPGPVERQALRHPAVPYDLEWLFGEMALSEPRRTSVPPADR